MSVYDWATAEARAAVGKGKEAQKAELSSGCAEGENCSRWGAKGLADWVGKRWGSLRSWTASDLELSLKVVSLSRPVQGRGSDQSAHSERETAIGGVRVWEM